MKFSRIDTRAIDHSFAIDSEWRVSENLASIASDIRLLNDQRRYLGPENAQTKKVRRRQRKCSVEALRPGGAVQLSVDIARFRLT